MKKTMWSVSIFSLVLTAVALQFLPSSVPMHYNLSGEIDRWGSKYENLLFPAIILLTSLLWHAFTAYYEKKLASLSDEKARTETETNVKVLKITGVAMAILFTVMQIFILCGAYNAAKGTEAVSADMTSIIYVITGGIIAVLGCFMPSVKRNYIFGVRTSFSMYNDVTWKKSNTFGALTMVITGIITIVTAIFANEMLCTILVLAYLTLDVTVTLLYSHKVYKEELAKTADE